MRFPFEKTNKVTGAAKAKKMKVHDWLVTKEGDVMLFITHDGSDLMIGLSSDELNVMLDSAKGVKAAAKVSESEEDEKP